MLTIASSFMVGLGFSVWLVSAYAHAFVILYVVIVPLPHHCSDCCAAGNW